MKIIFIFRLSYIYIYIYMCVCVCVCILLGMGTKKIRLFKKNSNYLGYFPHKKNFKNFGGSQAPLGHQGVGM